MSEQQTVPNADEAKVPDILVAEPDVMRSTSSALEDILPVQIDDERYAEFQAMYYPRRNKTKGSTIERKHFFQIAEHLALVSARLNVVQSWIYLNYAESRMSSVHSDQTCSVLALNNFKVLLETASDSKIHAAARSFFEATGNGRQHIIRPSSLMKNGYEILYTGIPPSNDNTPTGNINVVDSIKTPAMSANAEQAKYWVESNVDQALRESFLNAARTLTAGLIGTEIGINNCYLRNMKQISLQDISKRFNDAVAQALQQLPARYTQGINRGLWEVPELPKEIVSGLGKYITSVAVREPNATCLTLKVMAVSRNKGQPVTDESMDWSLDHIAMTNNVYFSMAVHIPEDFVSFITQTPIGQKPPLQSLNIWASAWTRAAFRAPRAKQGGDGRITLGTAPRYVLLPSHVPQVIERRKKLGYFTEPGRCNEDGMYVSDNGRYYYCPPQQNMDDTNAKEYEKAVEEALAISYEAGSPLASQVRGTTHKLFDLQNPGYADRIRAVKSNLANYMGSMQTFSWDYNCMLSVSPSDADKLVSIPLEGSTKPDELGISDYLNMDLGKAIDVLFSSTPLILESGSRGETPTPEDYMQDLSLFTQNAAFVHFVQFYGYLMREKRVPEFADLLQAAIKELGYDKEDRKEDWTTFESTIYGMYITPEMKPHPGLNNQDVGSFVKAVTYVVKASFNEAQAKPRTKMLNYIVAKSIQNPEDTGRYIGGDAKLQDLRHLYAYVGGNIFRQMMLAIKKLDPKLLFKPIELKDQELPISMRWICQEIMPIVTIFGKYVPDHERINSIAEDQAKTTVQDLSVTPDDVQIPGSRDGFQMFPHQMGTMQFLMGHPRFAFLDIAPGGGKTTLGLSELAMLVGKKLIKRPVVFAPNNLVKNWVEDMHKHTEGRWNVIPITTSIYNTWGEERLTKLITNAPRNTVVVVSNSVLRLRKFTVVIGNYVSMLSATLEFVRKFGFDYVLLDESHRNRNKRTTVHRAVKMLCTMTSVKFVRQATGTMIHNKLTDVVGQASLFSGQIFRTPEEYEAENSERIGDTKVLTWKKDTPKRARAQLSRYSAVISYKRKEWAFMLPIPIETFIPVSLDNNVDSEGGAAHKLMYQAILTETLDEIRQNERVKKLLSGVNDEDDDDDDENGNAGLAKAAGADALAVGGVEKALSASEDLDDETLAELESELEPYLQRLEQMLTDPIGDPFGEIYFKGINREGFVSSKVRKIIDRIKLNFIDFPWKAGNIYKPRDIVDHKDVRYTLMPAGDDDRAEYQSTTPPDQDKRWKVEARGKVIVFCRYIRTVNAIYRALPPDLKKLAVKFHGEIPDRQNNLDLFKSTPYSKDKGIQILIANEMSISEGQNLQMASRLIRVEAPWAPGELDQSMSRIFRPDVSGVFARESIFLDWILCNGTLEVAKMGRLISKMLTKAQFDEADNPLYDTLNSGQLPLIRMSMEMIASVPLLDDIMDYIDEYRNLVSIQSSEFKEMRAKHTAKMIPIPATPMFEDAKILEQVPYLPNMEVPDRHGLGLVKLLDFLQDTDNPDAVMALSSKDGLIGKPVHTEFGNGVISNVGYSRVKGENGTEDLRRVTRIDVKLINTDETYSAAPSMIHLVSNPKADVALLKATSPKEKVATKADKIKAERAAEKARQLEARESRRAERQRERETKQLERLRAVENKVKNKRELVLEDGNIKVYKLNDEQYYATDKEYRVDIEKVEGVWTLAHEGEELEANPRTSKAAIKAAVEWINAQHEEPAEEENNNIELFPVVYNGFLALEATPEDEDIDMSAYGFKEFGPYAYCQIKDRISYDALLKFLYSKFEIPAKSREQLEAFNEAFVSGRGRKFDVELAPIADLPKFHMLRHKMSQINKVSKKPELRIYPVVMNGALLMNVNISTNPAIRKYLNKPIPGTRNVKFQEADGLSIKFYQSRSELQADVKKLVNEGFEITNADELKSEIAALKTKRK